ncbi:unnamed protein product [Urochloa humidicola]
MWERDGALEDQIMHAWQKEAAHGDLGTISTALAGVMKSLKQWSSEKFGSVRKELENLRRKLGELQGEGADEKEIKEHMRAMNEMLYREEMMWLQRSRVSWLKEGDRNTRFFHQRAAWRARRNKIRRIKNTEGDWVNDQVMMKGMVNQYFEMLYSKDPHVNPDVVSSLFTSHITDEMNEDLCKVFSDDEISTALFQIGPLKAPGPDGFPARFFQRNWELLGEDIIRAVKIFFEEGRMPEGVNDTAIVLIPKVQHPETLKDYRPISLCNVVYKVVSKCLVNRLRPLLGDLISENQSAFVPGRLITDNALIAFECIHAIQQAETSRSEFCAYKLDLAKAYDRVDWTYLEQVLQKLGFHRKWVQWVMECVTTVRYRVRFNGVLLDTIQPTRGLRQGDPLSPYLFLFVADGLSKVLQHASTEGHIQGLRVCRRAPEVTHLLFADDSLLFFRAVEEQAERVKEALQKFCRGTGQLINFDKCSIMFNEKQEEERIASVKHQLNVHRVSFEAKYLGLPTPEGRMKADRFQAITERLMQRCNAWEEKFLSSAAKEVLIKSVAQAIPVYVMGVFKLSGQLHESLTRCIRRFWWGEKEGRRRTHWISWEKFTKSKGQGGLGFRDLALFNQALLARQAWRLVERPDSLCARVLKAKYYPNGNLLDTAFPVCQSPTWKAIVHGLELLKKGIVWKIGSGTNIRIWRDPWLPRRWTFKPAGKRRPCRLKWVSQLIDQTTMEWKQELILDYFKHFDVQHILDIRLPTRPREDCISWHFEKSGVFSVRSAYRLARDLQEVDRGNHLSTSANQEQRSVWNQFWKMPIPHKILVFGWRVMNNGLATQRNKRSRSIVPNSCCEICGMEDETVAHALVQCQHAKLLRQAVRTHWPSLPDELQCTRLQPENLLATLNGLDVDAGAKLLLLLWRTWQVRNNITHESEKFSIVGSVNFLLKYWQEVCSVRQQQKGSDPHGKSPVLDSLRDDTKCKLPRLKGRWKPREQGWIKLNVDGAFDSCTGDGGVGVIIRDREGSVLLSSWRYFQRGKDAEEMEALAAKEGLMLAAEWHACNTILETDCITVARALRERNAGRSNTSFILEEAMEAAGGLPEWTVVHARRECNEAAHELAQLAKRTKHSATWHSAQPVCIEHIIARECNRPPE